MVVIETLTEPFDDALTAGARNLFRAYAGFFRTINGCHGFDFKRFEQEILNLPLPYTTANGELLLALADSRPVGCIGFRATTTVVAAHTAERLNTEASDAESYPAHPTVCELKRLFVLPSQRGQGIAERLVLTALHHACQRGFRTAILDTEPSTMQAATSSTASSASPNSAPSPPAPHKAQSSSARISENGSRPEPQPV